MKELLMKYKEIIMYLIFGTLTTVVNIVVYYLFSNIIHMNYLFSNAVAWFLSVLFAYVTNRKYVFDSKNNQIIKEGSKLSWNNIKEVNKMKKNKVINIVNDVVAKVVVNVIVVILNYILSKLVVFKK